MSSNFERVSNWLKACGKPRTEDSLSIQIGCHLEELVEFIDQIELVGGAGFAIENKLRFAAQLLDEVSTSIKTREILAVIPAENRERALDALCDADVTGNGVAYFAGFAKDEADAAVLLANDNKLVDGKPVILPGGKIGKPPGWKAPDLKGFV